MSRKQMFKITCKICGKEFIANSCQRSLCSDKCKEETKLRIARERALKLEKENNREKYRKENRKAIVDLAVEARKAGMTYGQYTAMLMMQKEREAND